MKTIVNTKGETNQNALPPMNQNEYGFKIIFTIIENDTPFDLTDFTVNFQTKSISGSSLKVNSECTKTDAEKGICEYTITSTDFDEIGLYSAELDMTSGSKKRISKLGMFAVREDLS